MTVGEKEATALRMMVIISVIPHRVRSTCAAEAEEHVVLSNARGCANMLWP